MSGKKTSNRLQEARAELDIYMVCGALAQANGCYTVAAELLGCSKRNVMYLVKHYQLRNQDVEKYSAHFDRPIAKAQNA